jgi:tetratricopeptide (TPR) repeat protein
MDARTDRAPGFVLRDAAILADPLPLIRVYHEAGSFQEARDLAEAALEHVRGQTRVAILLILADSLMLLGTAAEARRLYDELPTPDDPELRMECDLLDARLLREEGRYELCRQRYAATVAMDRTVDRPRIRLRFVVAECERRLNLLDAARAGFERALACAGACGWTEGVADGLMSLALLDRMEGHWDRGERLLSRAVDLYREVGAVLKKVQATLNLGVHRLWMGRVRLSQETLKEAVVLSMELGRTQMESTARADLGLSHVRAGQLEEARVELGLALRLARRHGAPRRLAIALEYIGEYHLAA